jgi:DNA-binding transcriptional MerR regulator
VADVNDETYTVGAVARLAGVSVRTLHHYDQIGLLSPVTRSPAGYRLYSLADLKRLQQILYYRELGLHRCLAEMYLRDERFGKNYEDMAPGLAQYVHDAMLANATRATP